MPEKEKTATPPNEEAQAELWERAALEIFVRHLPMGRATGYDTLAREAFATAKLFVDVAAEVRDGNAELPTVKAVNTPSPMVAVKYEDPENPGSYITRMEPADTDITMPNLPENHPQSQRCITDPRHKQEALTSASR